MTSSLQSGADAAFREARARRDTTSWTDIVKDERAGAETRETIVQYSQGRTPLLLEHVLHRGLDKTLLHKGLCGGGRGGEVFNRLECLNG